MERTALASESWPRRATNPRILNPVGWLPSFVTREAPHRVSKLWEAVEPLTARTASHSTRLSTGDAACGMLAEQPLQRHRVAYVGQCRQLVRTPCVPDERVQQIAAHLAVEPFSDGAVVRFHPESVDRSARRAFGDAAAVHPQTVHAGSLDECEKVPASRTAEHG